LAELQSLIQQVAVAKGLHNMEVKDPEYRMDLDQLIRAKVAENLVE
jgi:hypothetical protein